VGGNDQWSNILAGADLIRRVDAKKAFAVTFPLLVGSDGRKYGKSAGNATWLDPSMTSPYEFFQFFRNVPDADIALLRRIFSFDPMDAISLQASGAVGINVNEVKERMALDITALVHGHGEAENALSAARALFSGGGDLSGAPSSTVAPADVDAGLGFVQLLVKVGLCPSNGEARKLIQGNGLTVNGERLVDATAKVTMEHFETEQGALVLRKGKKEYHLVRLAGG
jgi:tyrosyl-tRNA synthetase